MDDVFYISSTPKSIEVLSVWSFAKNLLFFLLICFWFFRMPSPYVPVSDVGLLKLVFLDAAGIALIAYVISLSLARIMASKHRYQVNLFL